MKERLKLAAAVCVVACATYLANNAYMKERREERYSVRTQELAA
jgi:hypothetical protein